MGRQQKENRSIVANRGNISKFSTAITQKGLASPNKFKVDITPPPSLSLGQGANLPHLNLMCESAPVAGRTVQSILDRQYGVNREIAYNGPTYTPITLAFLISSDYAEKRIFDRWNDHVVSIKKGWDVAYYKDYIGEMTITTLDRDLTPMHIQKYHECYPKTVAAIELNHSTTNTPVRLTVEMQYAYWETNDLAVQQNQTSAALRKGQDLLGDLREDGTRRDFSSI